MRAKDEKLFDSLNRLERALKAPSHKLSAAQLRAVRFNQCVLLLHGKQVSLLRWCVVVCFCFCLLLIHSLWSSLLAVEEVR